MLHRKCWQNSLELTPDTLSYPEISFSRHWRCKHCSWFTHQILMPTVVEGVSSMRSWWLFSMWEQDQRWILLTTIIITTSRRVQCSNKIKPHHERKTSETRSANKRCKIIGVTRGKSMQEMLATSKTTKSSKTWKEGWSVSLCSKNSSDIRLGKTYPEKVYTILPSMRGFSYSPDLIWNSMSREKRKERQNHFLLHCIFEKTVYLWRQGVKVFLWNEENQRKMKVSISLTVCVHFTKLSCKAVRKKKNCEHMIWVRSASSGVRQGNSSEDLPEETLSQKGNPIFISFSFMSLFRISFSSVFDTLYSLQEKNDSTENVNVLSARLLSSRQSSEGYSTRHSDAFARIPAISGRNCVRMRDFSEDWTRKRLKERKTERRRSSSFSKYHDTAAKGIAVIKGNWQNDLSVKTRENPGWKFDNRFPIRLEKRERGQ